MVSNNNSDLRPIHDPVKAPEPSIRKNETLQRLGPQNWIENLEDIIFESGIDIHNHTSKSISHMNDRKELLEFSKDLYKLIDVSKDTFGDEPSIIDLCKKMNKLAFNLVFKFAAKNDHTNEHLVIFGSKDKNSKLNQLPRELVDIIAQNMFESKLKTSIDSFKAQE